MFCFFIDIIQYQLIHDMFDGIVHKWMLKKFIIANTHYQNTTCSKQIASESLKFKPKNAQQFDFFKLQTS